MFVQEEKGDIIKFRGLHAVPLISHISRSCFISDKALLLVF